MEVEQRKTRTVFLNENEIRENITYIILFNNLFNLFNNLRHGNLLLLSINVGLSGK